MNLFTISHLERFSGIKAHTIRMWEQRYNALKPKRSDGNTRSYDGQQLRRLLNIVSLMDSDYKVSELCSMPDEKLYQILNAQLKDQLSQDDLTSYFITQLISAGMAYDENHFEKIFSHSLLRFGMKDTYIKVIYPMLVQIGLMWAGDTVPPAQEHFISNIIRQKLFSAIDALPPPNTTRNRWILFLPEDEFHEIGLLVAHYMIRMSGDSVVYLGANVPLETLKQSALIVKPNNLLFFIVNNNTTEDTQGFVNSMVKNFPKTKIYLSGNEKLISSLKLGKQTHWLNRVDELTSTLA